MTMRYGASPGEWKHFSEVLGLTDDILPVVCNPNVPISLDSTLKAIGKTPSKVSNWGRASGIAAWTSKHTTPQDIAKWQKCPDHGICIQTRRVHALDFDIVNPERAVEAERIVVRLLGCMPVRYRRDSSKFLIPFYVKSETDEVMRKRSFDLAHRPDGIVEFLANGQQFVAIGYHQSGQFYEWRNTAGDHQLPASIPVVDEDDFENLWTVLRGALGNPDSDKRDNGRGKLRTNEIVERDPVAQFLIITERVKSIARDGMMAVECPWEHEHSGPSSDTATVYWPANTGGYARGHFKCLHAHCADRTTDDFRREIGADDSLEFDDLTSPPAGEQDPQFDDLTQGEGEKPKESKPRRFMVQNLLDFSEAPPMQWLIKGALPRGELAVIYGDSGSGKSFFAFDMAASIARGRNWRGRRTARGRVVYICAEGAAGARGRVKAYCMEHGIDYDDLDIGVVADAPNLLRAPEVKDLIGAVSEWGGTAGVDLVIVDTLAQTCPGANENSGEDMGLALGHCRALSKRTGATVMLIHHSGKDKAKGARGWSGLRAAADVEIEVSYDEASGDREAVVTKMKDGESGNTFPFKLRVVGVDTDEDGDMVTSCVLDHGPDRLPRRKNPARKPGVSAGGIEKLVAETALTLAALDGTGAGIPVVGLVAEVVGRLPWDEEGGKRDTRRTKVLRAIENLQAAEFCELSGGKLFVVGELGA